MYTSGVVSNLEYLYIDSSKHYSSSGKDDKDKHHPCPHHDPCCEDCRYCEYNPYRSCLDPMQDDRSDVLKFIDRITATINGGSYIEECNCHEDGHVREDFICDCYGGIVC